MDAHVVGVLDGDSRLVDCMITDLLYIEGFIEGCVLSTGLIKLGDFGVAHFLDCYSGIPGTGTPIINMAGSGQGLALRNYNGGILLTNKTGPESVSLDINSGTVKLDLQGNYGDNGIINGKLVIRGIGKCIEATTGEVIKSGTYGTLEVINEMVNNPAISDYVWEYTA